MELTPTEQAFVDRRRRLVALWPYTFSGLLAGLLGFAIWLWFSVPLMINPWATLAALEAETIEETTLYVMAVLLPIMVLALLGAIVVVLSLFFAAFRNERKLIEMLEKRC